MIIFTPHVFDLLSHLNVFSKVFIFTIFLLLVIAVMQTSARPQCKNFHFDINSPFQLNEMKLRSRKPVQQYFSHGTSRRNRSSGGHFAQLANGRSLVGPHLQSERNHRHSGH